MNTQLVDSIVQMVQTLRPAERELVKQKLSILSDFRSERLRQREWSASKTDLTLEDRRAFLRKPLAQRQLILATQAQQMVEHYQTSTEWRKLMAGDIIDD
jgi:erythromycin esterase-like protein